MNLDRIRQDKNFNYLDRSVIRDNRNIEPISTFPIKNPMDELRVNDFVKPPPLARRVKGADELESERIRLWGEKVDISPDKLFTLFKNKIVKIPRRDGDGKLERDPTTGQPIMIFKNWSDLLQNPKDTLDRIKTILQDIPGQVPTMLGAQQANIGVIAQNIVNIGEFKNEIINELQILRHAIWQRRNTGILESEDVQSDQIIDSILQTDQDSYNQLVSKIVKDGDILVEVDELLNNVNINRYVRTFLENNNILISAYYMNLQNLIVKKQSGFDVGKIKLKESLQNILNKKTSILGSQKPAITFGDPWSTPLKEYSSVHQQLFGKMMIKYREDQKEPMSDEDKPEMIKDYFNDFITWATKKSSENEILSESDFNNAVELFLKASFKDEQEEDEEKEEDELTHRLNKLNIPNDINLKEFQNLDKHILKKIFNVLPGNDNAKSYAMDGINYYMENNNFLHVGIKNIIKKINNGIYDNRKKYDRYKYWEQEEEEEEEEEEDEMVTYTAEFNNEIKYKGKEIKSTDQGDNIGLPGNPKFIDKYYYDHINKNFKFKLIHYINNYASKKENNISYRDFDKLESNSIQIYIRNGKYKIHIVRSNKITLEKI